MTETRIPTAVTRTRRRTRHGLHAVLTVLTGGAWGFVWLACWAWNRSVAAEKSTTHYR